MTGFLFLKNKKKHLSQGYFQLHQVMTHNSLMALLLLQPLEHLWVQNQKCSGWTHCYNFKRN